MTEKTGQLEGTWQMIRGELAGEEAPELVVRKTELEFAGGAYLVRFDGEIVDCGTYEASVTLTTKSLTLHGQEGTNAHRTIPCIYQLAGDRLRICYGLNSFTPNAFSATAEQQWYRAIYMRKTP